MDWTRYAKTLPPTSVAERLGSPAAGAKGLQLVWTTVEEVRSSLEGWFAGNSIPGPEKNVGKPFLQGYWHRWVVGWVEGWAVWQKERRSPEGKLLLMALRGMPCAHMATVQPAPLPTQPCCCRWSGEVCGRQRAAPHMKSYLRCGLLLCCASLLSKSTVTIQCVDAALLHGTATPWFHACNCSPPPIRPQVPWQ